MNIWDEVFKSGVYPSRDHTLRHLKIGRVFKLHRWEHEFILNIHFLYEHLLQQFYEDIFKKMCNKRYNMVRCKNENLSTKDV